MACVMPNFWICSAPSAASSTDMPSSSAIALHGACARARRRAACRRRAGRGRGAGGRAGAARRSRSARAAAAVAGRAGVGAGRLRADAEDAALVDVGDGAAAGADGVDVDHRHHGLVVADLRVEQVAHAQLAAGGHADVGRGAADVERDDVLEARPCGPAQMPPIRPATGPGHEQVDGPLRGRLDRSPCRPTTASAARRGGSPPPAWPSAKRAT